MRGDKYTYSITANECVGNNTQIALRLINVWGDQYTDSITADKWVREQYTDSITADECLGGTKHR